MPKGQNLTSPDGKLCLVGAASPCFAALRGADDRTTTAPHPRTGGHMRVFAHVVTRHASAAVPIMTASSTSMATAVSRSSAGPTARLRLQLCGQWRLSFGEHVVRTQPTEQRLLALLALRGAQPRTTIAGLLWPHSAEAHARGSLRSTIWRIRKAIPPALTSKPPYLALDVTVDVDANRLARAAHVLTDMPTQDIQAATAEFQLLAQTDELLPGWYDDWVLIERERLYQLRLHALEAYAERLAALRRYTDALEAAFTALAAEPYRESPYQLIARIHLAEGNINEAIRAFQLYHRVVVDELDPAAHVPSPHANLADVKRWLRRD